MTLGEAIRARRAGDSGRKVAPALGISHSNLSRIERAEIRPSYDTAVKLAAWLGWTVEQVMAGARAS